MSEVLQKFFQLFLVLGLLFGVASLPSFAWLSGYGYKINTTITASVAGTYPTALNISYDADMQTDFDDIHFTNSGDSAVGFWLQEKSDSKWAVFWVNATWTTGNNTIMMYYGNSTDASGSSITSVWTWYDDFEDADYTAKWTAVAGSWSETGGYLTGSGNELGIKTKSSMTTDYIILLDAENSGDGQMKVITGIDDNTHFFRQNLNNFDQYYYTGSWTSVSLTGSGNFPASDGRQWVKITEYGNNRSAVVREHLGYGSDSHNNDGGYFGFAGGTIKVYNAYSAPYVFPVPTYSFGSEQALFHNAVISATGTTYVDNEITFLVSKSGEVISKSWWNFADGNSSYYVAGNSTKHIFGTSGLFNVSVIATNSSGSNETDYYELNIYETQVTFALRNSQTDAFLSNWSLTVYNSTSSEAFSVTNNQTINYTTMKGIVSVYPLKNEYNTTVSNFTQSSTSNQTIILNATPALVWINVYDYLFPDATVPVKIKYSNESKSVTHSYEGWTNSSIYSESDTLLFVEETHQTELAQLFKYNFSTVGTQDATEWDNENFTVFLCSVDDVCYNIEYDDNWNPAVSLNHLIYLDKDGTFTIRELDGTVVDTGAFPYFPAYLKVVAYAGDLSEDADMNVVYLGLSTNLKNYDVVYPSEVSGNVTAFIEQDTSGIYGYLDNLYKSNRFFVQSTPFSIYNYTAYLIGTTEGYSVRFSVYDASNSIAPNSVVKIYRLVNSTYEELGSAKTDETGSTPYFWTSPDESLWVIATRGSDSTGLHNVVVSQTAYDVRLQFELETETLPSFFGGVTLAFSPSGSTVYDNSSFQNFTMNLIDPESYLINVTAVLNSSTYEFEHNFASTDSSVAFFNQSVNLTELSGYSADIAFYYNIYRENSAGEVEQLLGVNEWVVVSSENLISRLSEIDLGGFKSLIALVILAGSVVVSMWIAIFASIILGLIGFITWDVVLIGVILAVMTRIREASE